MFSSEEPRVDRPSAWTDHGQSATQDPHHSRHPDIASAVDGDPHLEGCNQSTDYGGPQSHQQQQPQDGPSELRELQAICTLSGQGELRLVEQCRGDDEALQEQTEAWPAIREGCKQSLHTCLIRERTAMARDAERPKVGPAVLLKAGRALLLSDDLELEDPALESDGYRVGPVAGAELGEDIADAALDGGLSHAEAIGDLLVGIAVCDQP